MIFLDYLITFLEGLISFISPCVLPLLPVYISYFAGGADKRTASFARAFCFVLGFTLTFSLLGLFAGSLGSFFGKYNTLLNITSGALVIVFGLSYLEILPFGFFKGINSNYKVSNAFSAFIFGVIFSVNLTPCVGTFLGSALMLASYSKTAFKGILLLLCYSLGIGIPFLISAVLIEKLNNVFTVIKKHYRIINIICGLFLIITGVLMMFGILNKFILGVG